MPELVLDKQQLRQLEQEFLSEILKAQKGAVEDSTRWLEREFEALFRTAVSGDRAWRIWTSQVFPGSSALAYEPSGTVYGNGGRRAQGLLTYFSIAGTNRAKHGTYLAVPLPGTLGTHKGRNISPREWEAASGVKLRPLFRPGKTPLLVADVARDRAGRNLPRGKADAMRRGGQDVTPVRTQAVFALLDAQPFANRVALAPPIQRARDRMADSFGRRIGNWAR